MVLDHKYNCTVSLSASPVVSATATNSADSPDMNTPYSAVHHPPEDSTVATTSIHHAPHYCLSSIPPDSNATASVSTHTMQKGIDIIAIAIIEARL